jgi:hypothetical protein
MGRFFSTWQEIFSRIFEYNRCKLGLIDFGNFPGQTGYNISQFPLFVVVGIIGKLFFPLYWIHFFIRWFGGCIIQWNQFEAHKGSIEMEAYSQIQIHRGDINFFYYLQ